MKKQFEERFYRLGVSRLNWKNGIDSCCENGLSSSRQMDLDFCCKKGIDIWRRSFHVNLSILIILGVFPMLAAASTVTVTVGQPRQYAVLKTLISIACNYTLNQGELLTDHFLN